MELAASKDERLAQLRTQLAAFEHNTGGKSSSEPARQESEQAEAAYQKILRCLAASEQSSIKLRQKLLRAGFSDKDAEEALDRAQAVGVVDDCRYAELLVRHCLACGKGLRHARQELEELGVDIEQLEAYQEHMALGEDAELERALQVLQAHPPRSKNLREAAYRKLVNKGFGSELAARAARRWFESQAAL